MPQNLERRVCSTFVKARRSSALSPPPALNPSCNRRIRCRVQQRLYQWELSKSYRTARVKQKQRLFLLPHGGDYYENGAVGYTATCDRTDSTARGQSSNQGCDRESRHNSAHSAL
eukprot:5505361-Prymnesium_polylepis.2